MRALTIAHCPPVAPRCQHNKERDIYAQRINADSGELINARIQVNDSCPKSADTYTPAVIWNATNIEYLVAWKGDALDGVANGLAEVFVQRLSSSGAKLGSSRINRISESDNGNSEFYVDAVDIAWDSVDNRNLVAWHGVHDPDFPSILEIHVQDLATDYSRTAPQGARITDVGPMLQGHSQWALEPAVATANAKEGFLVVYYANDVRDGQLANEYEVFGQLLGGIEIFEDGFETPQ